LFKVLILVFVINKLINFWFYALEQALGFPRDLMEQQLALLGSPCS
jgi:hypothetical protein